MTPSKMFLHVDLDAFFASVEILDNPELKGKPLIVGGLPGERRSVVSTCSYEARKYGVHSAMPVNRAYELCPQAVFVHGRMERYHEKSQEVMSVFRDFSPDVMQMSIDEAFIDITGTEMLFGTPEQLAIKLKKQVLEKTGLTVSVGIASNRYVAKIASGLRKPDGLCYVPAGQEENFMLSLPLDKLWGIGTKSRERLNACGIFTIPEIHAISETALKELFGEASGSFLYRSVRGMDVEHFGDETKSRSMSAERTFCFDLSDIYTIETELLHLSYDVMFRVLRDKVNSKTVCLKIRYEDFTTVTITESSTRIVSSIEDLFERSCRLFHRKYERGRGIRLLGLGLQNVSDGLESEQGELFDFGEKKQRSVEKTVLKLHQKNPSSKIKKARQLIVQLIAVLFLTRALLPIHAEQEDNPALLDLSYFDEESKISVKPLISDNENIEFDVQGSWEALLSGGSTVFIGDAAPVLSLKTPVFTQKAELYLWFMYDSHWYFEASVATDSDRNTIAMGYEGDGLIREVRAATDTGTENGSPGVKIRLEGNGWNLNSSIHLDSIQTHTKTWKGSSELVTSTIPLSSFMTGTLFSAINPECTKSITALYVEDSAGTWKDASGRRYKKLSADSYLLLPGKSLIYLETPAKGAVIAETANQNGMQERLPSFLKEVSDWFGDRGTESTYSMMGISCTDESCGPTASETAPLFTSITDGSSQYYQGMYLSRPGYFSPFQVASLYTVPFSEDSVLSVDSDSLYADYSSPVLTGSSQKTVQLFTSESISITDFASPSVRFPAARAYPWIYLPSSGITHDEMPSISGTKAEQSDSFSIGTQAIESSVQVFRNRVPVPAVYDKSSGKVTISGYHSQSDTITIIWNEYSSKNQDMTFSAGFDFSAAPTPYLSLSADGTSVFFIDPVTRRLSTSAEKEPYAAGSFKSSWARSFSNFSFTAYNTASIKGFLSSESMKSPLLSFSGDGSEEAWITGSPKNTAQVPELTARSGNPAASLPVLDEDGRNVFALQSARIAGKSGYSATFTGTLSRNEGTTHWYAADIPLSSGASLLSSAHDFTLSMTDLSQSSGNYDIYLQLGIDASGNKASITSDDVSTWLISRTSSSTDPERSAGKDVLLPFMLNEDGTQTVSIHLTDEDRLRLSQNQDMRLVFVNRDDFHDTEVSVSLCLAPSAINGISFNVSAANENSASIPLSVSTAEVPFPVPLSETGWIQSSQKADYAACISWDSAEASSGDTIRIERSCNSVSLAQWQKASVILYVPQDSAATDVTVNLLSKVRDSWISSKQFTITRDELESHKGSWYIKTESLSSSDTVSKVQFILDAWLDSQEERDSLYIAGVFLSEPVPYLMAGDEASASISWSSGGYAAELKADASASAAGMTSPSLNIREKSLTSSVSGSFSAPFISLSGSGTFDIPSFSLISGEYNVATRGNFLAGIAGFSETYRFSKPQDSTYRKDTISLSLAKIDVPLSINASRETDKASAFVSDSVSFKETISLNSGKTELSLVLNQAKAPESGFSVAGTQNARKKTESASVSQSFSFAKGVFSPSLELKCISVSEKEKSERSGSFSQKFTLPVTIKSNRISFTWSRETVSGYTADMATHTYWDDIKAFASSFSPHLDALSIVPVADLFSDGISEQIRRSLEKDTRTIRSSYTSSGTLSWNRSIRGDRYDLIIPNSASFTASRMLSNAGLNTLDKKTSSLLFVFTAFNCFGSSSAKPVFTWYEQDELQYSARFTFGSGTFKTQLDGYATLYLKDDAECTAFYSGTLSNTGTDSHTLQFAWNRSGTMFEKPATYTTSGSFTASESTSARKTDTLGLTQKANVALTEMFSVNGTAAATLQIGNSKTLAVTLSIGGKLQF